MQSLQAYSSYVIQDTADVMGNLWTKIKNNLLTSAEAFDMDTPMSSDQKSSARKLGGLHTQQWLDCSTALKRHHAQRYHAYRCTARDA